MIFKNFWILLFSCLSCLARASDFTYESLPVQENGRIKPLITLAKESLQLIHGRSRFEGKPALDIFTTWILVPRAWENKNIIEINHHGLKKTLGLEKNQKYFSPKQINSHPHLNVLFSDLKNRLERKEKLDPYYQAVQRLKAQLFTFYGITRGNLHIFPHSEESGNDSWISLEKLKPSTAEKFFKVLSAYTTQFLEPKTLTKERGKEKLKQAIREFTEEAKKTNKSYPEASDMAIEVHYQKLNPFLWTWIIYLLASLLYAFAFLFPVATDPQKSSEKNPLKTSGEKKDSQNKIFPKVIGTLSTILPKIAAMTLILGFVFHTYGFILRCLITGRPPVSNMYETVVWVGWGVVLFTGIFYFLKKHPFLILSGSLVATLCMMVADFAPVILDDRLNPLEPVLRSNLWLTIHVMTITLSYAAFFLALGVGDYGLFLKISGKHLSKIRELAQTTYHLIQVGVVLLATGTILGGVWADYSWGRFWGWDPKETWAFIALMGYIALLHARLVGWVKDFGMLAGAVVAFSLIIMAWYGVNFILGAGLHSYGFGAGGVHWVAGFVILQLITVTYARFVG